MRRSALGRQIWIEVRAAELAASMLTGRAPSRLHGWTRAEIVGWAMYANDRDRLGDPPRRAHPTSDRWHAGYLAALIWDGNRSWTATASDR